MFKVKSRDVIPEIQKIGVYAIHNTKTNKYYIGSSVNVYSRLRKQYNNINSGYVNKRIFEDIAKYGFGNFEFLILETFEDNTITDRQLRNKELEYMIKYDSLENGYNINYPWETGTYKNKILVCPVVDVASNYTIEKESITAALPKGTKERITSTGESVNGLINKLVMEWLQQQEQNNK